MTLTASRYSRSFITLGVGLIAGVMLLGGGGCHNPYGPPGDSGGQRDPYRRGWVEPCDPPTTYASVSVYSTTSYGHDDDDCGPSFVHIYNEPSYCPPKPYCPPPVVYCPPPAAYCPPKAYAPSKSYGSSHGGRRDSDRPAKSYKPTSNPSASSPPKASKPIAPGRGFGKNENPIASSKGVGDHKPTGFRGGLDRSR